MTTSTLTYATQDFNVNTLPFAIDSKRWVTIPSDHRLYHLLLGFIAKNLQNDHCGYSVQVNSKQDEDEEEEEEEYDDDCCGGGKLSRNTKLVRLDANGRISVEIGFGHYAFTTLDGDHVDVVHNMVGKPVGTSCGAQVMKSLSLFTENPLEVLTKFFGQLLELAEQTSEGMFTCYVWHIRHSYWKVESRVKSRPIDSVVLPNATKQRVIQDIEKFLSKKSRHFYLRNGIPYRRAYLFHGIPGTGKTSFVQALAGHFRRSVCYLLPSHPDMTDDSLRESITRIPAKSIVVFEDIDALFTKDRVSKNEKSALTFSGLLNALDGIGNPNGQIFVLTTNLREELDNALIRNGRVDMHVEFGYAVDEQFELIWRNFYPDALELASSFAHSVRAHLDKEELNVTMAELQHFFITQMDASPADALSNVGLIIEEIKFNSSQRMLEAAAATKKDETAKKPEQQGKGESGKKAKKIASTKTPATKVGNKEVNEVSETGSTEPTEEGSESKVVEAESVLDSSTTNSSDVKPQKRRTRRSKKKQNSAAKVAE